MKPATCAARLLAAASVLVFSAFTSQPADCQSSAQQAETLDARLPLLFEQNVGQTDSHVRYLTHSGRYQTYLLQNGVVLKVAGKENDAALRTTLQNANPKAPVIGLDQQTAKTNYLLGDRSHWKTGVANFAAIKYEGIFPGIDLKYYGRERQLEYDFDIAPHADPSMISLNIEGANKITTDKDGSLVLNTAAGEVRWRRPVAYQQSESGRQEIAASYRIEANRISFNLGTYDKNKSLVIDPTLVYGTYLDGNSFERYNSFLVDSAGYNYILGETGSSNFPTTPGAYQKYETSNFTGEVFVSKLSQDGSYLVWSTIVGGTGTNNASFPDAFALDASGNTYIVGETGDFTNGTNGTQNFSVSTFPTSSNAYNHAELASWRFFLVKLNSSGSALDYSTFLSNQPNIIPFGVAVDSGLNAYVTGEYNHASGLTGPFPATPGAYQSTYGGGNDAFVMKFNSTATALDYATLVGGANDDVSYQVLVDSAGEATIDGSTYSPTYPITANGLRQTDEGGFVTTLNSEGTGLVYSTVLNHVLYPNAMRDAAGYYYVGGEAGTNLPTTANAFQKTFPATGSGIHLGFLTEIDPAGNLVYSSYFAGNPLSLENTQILLASPNSVTVGGNRLGDSTFPVTDRSYEQDNCSFLATFNTHASGSASLVYSGCTPINMTNNTTYNEFRGIPYFNFSQLYLDGNNNLYGLNTSGQTSPNAFQKSPPQQSSGNGNFLWTGKYDLSQPGPGGVNLTAPEPEPNPYNSPVTFEATGRSPQCSAGVAAMRVYTSPGVVAYTTNGATLDANISFPVPSQNVYSFNPVIVVYDNCGKAFSMTIPIIIQGPQGTSTDPQVVSPTDGGVVTSPVHYVANASAPNCSKGISAMRIYTAPGVSAYSVNGNAIDTYLKMAIGTYNVVVQAWDNCGNVYKTPLKVTVE